LKLIRRIMPGVNPEVEMVRYLTENAYPNTPPLLGEVQNIRSDGSSYSMYVVQKFIPNQGDAWTYTLDHLCQRAHSNDEYRQFIHSVGTRLAQLHEVLVRPTDDKSFAPCAAGEGDIRGWVAGASWQIGLAFDVLETSKNMTGASEQDRHFVLENRHRIVAVLPDLGRAGLGALLTRVHGDFHLGQVLVAEEDAYIIDFEGEPSKPLDERRAKSSPLRDVAGLLRSLQYAAGASEASYQGFVSQMSDVFLSAYRAVHRTVERHWVKSEAQESDILDLFLLEKCAYEICYEAANRPNWLPIPLRGFSEIIARILRVSPEMRDA
jgi:maltose alpha-D-glucosyltransferase/alpha-amylase